jgi:sulfur-oxidizing protein SoxZ
MADTIKIRTAIKDGLVTVRALIKHPMDVGNDETPAHYITEVTVLHNGNPIMQSYWGPGISRNPYLSFEFAGGGAGDALTLSWVDNKGERDSLEVTIQ